jgi:hypothetical protein
VLIGFLAFDTLVKLQRVVRALLASFCIHLQLLIPIQASLWSGPVNSLVQLFIILLTNIFLAYRLVNLIDLLFTLTRHPFLTFSIHGVTKSRVQCLAPIPFSIIAFAFGMVTNVTSAWAQKCGFFMLTAESQLTLFEVPRRIGMLQRSSGTHHKL